MKNSSSSSSGSGSSSSSSGCPNTIVVASIEGMDVVAFLNSAWVGESSPLTHSPTGPRQAQGTRSQVEWDLLFPGEAAA
ncbi:hypothetical protein PAAG_11266 [Paracoccidioides lutzii Pb01]|uniref:Uncharacterized protein n=1 Tax=Paracoccidioides lutzii (strain ATCC MYA-826 / Pb01) TaxID=502779 RepID=A0A0A2V307_PARBA|nr:hypothetical protein PAAG_11266 [Paracoccidioides lutzii Pb01]KGQ01878.1 hypothetical protein PAAG_11266 [Paracoccidioides lutzii Pb01]